MFLALVLTVHYTQGLVDLKILYTNTCRRLILEKFLICKKGIHHTHHYLKKFLLKYNSKYLYIYIFYGLNDHNNTSYLSVL